MMLPVLADRTKLAPFLILKRKDLPKEKLPTGFLFKCIKKNGGTLRKNECRFHMRAKVNLPEKVRTLINL